ncbi:UDP-N-acetylmuramate dehydrogenase [Weissella diestrammenae]|uniref:UDP-N-acetylenolpyruvoylglucosamine reductase n=1 Tax=Weissella diestrammenae TaxID=1162633 RepID=A0A7G9T413_9LACO|nr:UDP-N-acetylmuramate dehydrogenase [Weissella diestrammenae]MCM0583036.1 UDP-N-acetylmuramate dehydrogenase [Weissella diestrammenae]QNN74838.1 UDP-N-acetylmuramate dehydrogenase [Weissella diestrammenae]
MINLNQKFPGYDIKSQVSLANYTNTQVGGTADWAFWPSSVSHLQEVLQCAHDNNMPITVIGNASNLVIGDAGLRGLVIFLSKLCQIEVSGERITAQAGAALIDVTNVAMAHSLSGVEWAAGIPGSVGGAVYMNAGAYDGYIARWIDSVQVLTADNQIKELTNAEMAFDYRQSRIQTSGEVILGATFKLVPGDRAAIEQAMTDFNIQRATKQPLEYPSAGSVFKRPPHHYAGKLIMDAGMQGYTVGGAQVSKKHAGFIVNFNHATASDYIAVIRAVQAQVKAKFDVELETEVKILGE